MSKKRSGFTLIEIMIVVVIIGLLAAMVGPRIAGKGELAKKEAAKSDMVTLASMVDMYKLQNSGAIPTYDQVNAPPLGPAPKNKFVADGKFTITDTSSGNYTITCTTSGGKTLTYNSATGEITET